MREALRLGAYEILFRETPRRAAVFEWVEVVKGSSRRLSGLVNAVLRRVTLPDTLSDAERLGVPQWLFREWQGLFGPRAQRVAEGMNTPEPLWLLSYHSSAKESLVEEGCEVLPGPLNGTLAVRPSKPLQHLEAYRCGFVQPQNPASTLPVRLLAPEEGERVLDLASGSGVKAAQLAFAGAKVLSIELYREKLERAEQNLSRLGLHAQGLVHDLTTVPDVSPAQKVLLDAPCTGTGTLRGHPEIRTRVTLERVQKAAALQVALLDTAAALTAPGGRLVYAVCALTRAEGSGAIQNFLAHHPEFHTEPFELDVPTADTPEGRYVLPLEGLDGFFIARLRRT